MTVEKPVNAQLAALRQAWKEGIDSGDAGEIDFAALKILAKAFRGELIGSD
jgi:antitoxin ParD1/3/4